VVGSGLGYGSGSGMGGLWWVLLGGGGACVGGVWLVGGLKGVRFGLLPGGPDIQGECVVLVYWGGAVGGWCRSGWAIRSVRGCSRGEGGGQVSCCGVGAGPGGFMSLLGSVLPSWALPLTCLAMRCQHFWASTGAGGRGAFVGVLEVRRRCVFLHSVRAQLLWVLGVGAVIGWGGVGARVAVGG